MPSLFVIQGRDQGRRFELLDRVLCVGRDVSNRVRLHDTEVSRRHAEIRQSADGYQWVDLGSSNGSFVNSVRVQQQALRSGDRVQLGRTLMVYTDSGDAREPADQGAVDIVVPSAVVQPSRIIRSVSHEEGSQLLAGFGASDSPWLARVAATCRSCIAPRWPSATRWTSTSCCTGSWN